MQYQRIIITTDGDGHEYVIPYELDDIFHDLLQKGEEAEEEFEEKFEQYMCGGDPFGEYEFYIKTNEKV